MKFTIDTDLKQITIQSDCNLIELVDKISLLFGDEISEYKIVTEKLVDYIPYFPVQPFYPIQPYYTSPITIDPIHPPYTICSSTTSQTIKS